MSEAFGKRSVPQARLALSEAFGRLFMPPHPQLSTQMLCPAPTKLQDALPNLSVRENRKRAIAEYMMK